MRKILALSLLILVISAFQNKNIYSYRYTLVMQVMQNDSAQIISANEFISYKGYLIEFIKKEFIEGQISPDPDKSTYKKWTENLKVHFIDISNNTYFSIDTFSQGCKLIAQGPLKEKDLGMNIGDSIDTADARDYNLSSCKDTIFNGIEYSYYPYSIKDNKGQDSILCKALFLKDADINLITSINPKSYLQGKYPLAGLIAFKKDLTQGFAMYIKDKKVISKNEALTIEKILEKHSKKN